jgi:protein-S-isoprenylcysteine O-methyltransferase Ste14
MRRAAFAYGAICYAVFFATFLYAIGFLGNLVVPKSIDSGAEGPLGLAIAINALLLGIFAVQHSVMARPGFKQRWTKLVPVQIERSTYTLISALLLLLLFWQWRPIPALVWQVEQPLAETLLTALFFSGFGIVLYSSFLIDHFDLFGLRQVFLHLRGEPYHHRPFGTPSLYKRLRHPLYLGWLITFWATPQMSYGHLLFSLLTSAYIFTAIPLEERDLMRFLGDDYRRYRERTPMFVHLPGWRPGRDRPAFSKGGSRD